MIIRYTTHALGNLTEDDHIKFGVTPKLIEDVMEYPDCEDYTRRGQIIAQRPIDEKHPLRVVYRREFNSTQTI